MAIDFMAARSSAPISEIVGRYVELRRTGREHIGLCPFHADSNPSLTVYTGRDNIGRYWCPVCGERGDAVDFVAAINSISLADAARLLGADELPAALARRVDKNIMGPARAGTIAVRRDRVARQCC